MLFVVTAKPELCFRRKCIGKSTLHTLFDRVTGRIYEIVKKLQHENVTGIRDRKVLLEHLEQPLDIPLVRSSFQLKEFFERLDLDFKQVRCFCEIFSFTEVD